MFIHACEDGYEQFLSAHLIHTDNWQADPRDGSLFLDCNVGNPRYFFDVLSVLCFKYPEAKKIITGENPDGSFEFNVRVPTGTLEYRFKVRWRKDSNDVEIRRVRRVDKETVL